MKILIIARGIPNKKDPQEGCFEWDQAKALARLGHEVVVMAIDGRVRKFWRKLGIDHVENDNVNGYKLFYFPTSIIRRLVSLRIGYKIEAYFAKYLYKKIIGIHGKFDIIHSHYLASTYLAVQIKNRYGGKLVATEHWSALKQPSLSKEVKFLGKHAYGNTDLLISVSKHLGESIKQHFGKDFVVVHNLLDPTHLLPALEKTSNKQFTILSVGSLLPIKGYDILIKALADSNLNSLPIVVKIIGGGPEKSHLEALIRSYKLNDKIVLMGQRSKKQVFDELHSADLYVLSSRSENFPVALIEATANGVPAIGTLCGGVDEYPVSNVMKIPVENVDAMVKAILESYKRQGNIDRKELQKETLRYFAPEVIAKKLENIYRFLIRS